MTTDQATRTHTDRTELRVLYRCKRDRLTIRRTFTRVESYTFSDVEPLPTHTIHYEEAGVIASRHFLPTQRCPLCPSFMDARPITGTLSPDTTCSPTCHAATGAVCRCSCAGARHGEVWQSS